MKRALPQQRPYSSLPIPVKNRKQDGFILIATLALLGLAVTTVIVVTKMVHMQSDLVEAKTHQAMARRNALTGLDIAIGQLQTTTGNDRVVTAPAATLLDMDPNNHASGNPWWTLAQESTSGKSTWLVSQSETSTPDPSTAIDLQRSITLVGANSTDPDQPGLWVTVEKVPLQTVPHSTAPSAATTGHYAYWTGELNTRANVKLTDSISATLSDPYLLAYNQLSHPRRMAAESILPSITDPEATDTQLQLSKSNTPEQLYYVTQNRDELRQRFHDVTTFSRSVLSNAIDGGLKINLTDPTYTDSIITAELRAQITPEYYRDFQTTSPQQFQVQGDEQAHVFAINDPLTSGQPLTLHQPLITDFSLSMGIFHTQSDRKHRLRFHMHVEWLNPYPYDMVFRHQRAFIIVADNLPTLEVSNETSGDRFTVDLNDFDRSLSSNTENESKINSWMEFDRLSSSGSSNQKYGIDAGHVYLMSEPDKNLQERGLARTIQEEPNRWTWREGSAPTTTPRLANSIYADDTIRIRSTTPVRMNLTVIPLFDGNAIPYETHPDDFATSKGFVLKMIHIPFEAIDLSMGGSTYSRPRSSDFAPPDYRLAFRFKINEDPTGIPIALLANSLSFRNPIIDFNQSTTRAVYEIFDVATAAKIPDPGTEQEKFWDDTHRSNAPSLTHEAYQFHLYDVPILDPISPGVFSQLHFHQKPHPWVGSPNASTSPLNQVYDRYYFSGYKVSPDWRTDPQPWTPNTPAGGVLANHRIRPVLKSDGTFPNAGDRVSPAEMNLAQAAASSLMEGGFNIYSASIEAWTAFLKNEYRNTPQLTIQKGAGDGPTTSNVFSRLPFGSAGISKQRADSTMNNPTETNQILYRQGSRALDSASDDPDEWIRKLAGTIVREIRADAQTASSTGAAPYDSLADFINAATIDRAIANTSVNGQSINSNLDPLSPGYLRQSDIFSLLGDQMNVRSDTFVIRSYGEATHPTSGRIQARAFCEAVVQRYPNYMIPSDDASQAPSETLNIVLGRRYRIVSFRWLQPHEI